MNTSIIPFGVRQGNEKRLVNTKKQEMEEGLAEVARIRAETLENVAKEFDQLDLDGNGMVDREELVEVAKRSGDSTGVD